MKMNRNKLLSLFLCLALLAGLICINTFAVSTEVKAGDSFAPDFAAWGSQNNNGWYYMYKDTDGIYRNLDYYDATASISWQQNAFAFNPSAMTSMQGNVALMKKLSEELPNCAFSGKGTNEITARYISFLQRAPYGINTGIASGAGSYDDSKIAMITPLDAYLWSGTTRLYHYPAMPTTENEATYNAYLRAGLRLGALPTMMRFSASEIISQSATTRRALNLMRWYQENDPVFNYARWDGDEFVVCYRTVGGKVVALSEALLW